MFTYSKHTNVLSGQDFYRIADANDDRVGEDTDELSAKRRVARMNREANNPLSISDLCTLALQNAEEKGFWKDGVSRSIPEQIALMHSELSEALEDFRSSHAVTDVYFEIDNPTKPCGFGIELVDWIIRIADTCAGLGIDLEALILKKMEYNRSRPHMHGKRC